MAFCQPSSPKHKCLDSVSQWPPYDPPPFSPNSHQPHPPPLQVLEVLYNNDCPCLGIVFLCALVGWTENRNTSVESQRTESRVHRNTASDATRGPVLDEIQCRGGASSSDVWRGGGGVKSYRVCFQRDRGSQPEPELDDSNPRRHNHLY